jgi:DMSO reductase anchor subunit
VKRQAELEDLRFLTAVNMKNAFLWDVTLWLLLEPTIRRRELGTALAVVPSSAFLVTLIIETICFSETSVLTREIRRHIPEDGILQNK